jgi:2-polyprenyl-3-methyl-5-hydroxy-6-metoxy-1,4-benzoquinol methylase
MPHHYKDVSKSWVKELETTGYEYHIQGVKDCRQLRLSRVWKRIFNETQLHKLGKLRILEVGCGGGIQLAKLATLGWECVGIDVSEGVLIRAENFFKEIHEVCGVKLNIKTIAGDFYEINKTELGEDYDLVFNFGVIEHILDDSARLEFLKKKYDLTKDGGYIISMVPNGSHSMREKMKTIKGGYNINLPEIDYDRHLMEQEFRMIGARQVRIFPHNLFGYKILEKKNMAIDYLQKIIFLTWQVIPQIILPSGFCFQHAGSLIGIARK